jgi:hypothetical protein
MAYMLTLNARNAKRDASPLRSAKQSDFKDPFSRSAPQIPLEPRDGRRVDDLVEQHRAPDQQRETCHLQPLDTSQMKSVRHVSIVLRAVAEIWRVTERPKKLKPLGRKSVSMTMGKGGVRVGVGKAYPMDTMIMRDVTAMVRLVNIWWKPSRASK